MALHRFSSGNLLRANILSFFDKKDLTNEIDGSILRAMNASEITPKVNSRMNRIQKVSRCFRAVFFIFTLLLTITTLWCSAGLVFVLFFQWHGIGEVLRFSLLIILVAWIMDEGRKIQEERELTV